MTVTSIFHLSDIHIRAGNSERSREQEYLAVFDNLFGLLRSFSSIEKSEAIIVLTGDLFHNKNKLEPHGIRIAIRLLQGLAAIAPTFVIRGNHDYRQDAPHELDLISAIVSYDIPNLSYIDETGAFEVENVGFGLVAIQDTLLYAATSGIVEELPPFPSVDVFSADVTHRVALFHGSVVQAKLQNGMACETGHGYPLEWFKGYDMVLLGDIHLQQVHRAEVVENSEKSCEESDEERTWTPLKTYRVEKGTWAYPGSLLQQDFGEGLLGHGILHWNLAKGCVEEYHVHNPFGFLTLQVRDRKQLVTSLDLSCVAAKDDSVVCAFHRFGGARVKGVWVELAELAKERWFPKRVNVRVMSKGVRDVVACRAALAAAGCEVLMCVEVGIGLSGGAGAGAAIETNRESIDEEGILEENLKEGNTLVAECGEGINSVNMWIQFVRENKGSELKDGWEQWLREPTHMLVPLDGAGGLAGVVKEKNDKAFRAIEGLRAEQDSIGVGGRRGTVRLKELEWSWLFNFGEGNRFNFEKHDGKICILNAKNGYGKSNFFEVVCIALFGIGFPSRFNKNYAGAILNEKVRGGDAGAGAGAGKRAKKEDVLCATTEIVFDCDSKTYRLIRSMVPRKDNRNLFDFSKIVLYERMAMGGGSEEDIEYGWSLVCQKKLAVDAWIEEHIGAAETFLSSAMLTQDGDFNFFEQDKASQKRILDSVFSLGAVQALGGVFAEAIKAHKSAMAHARTYLLGRGKEVEPTGEECNRTDLETQLEEGRAEIDTLRELIRNANDKWSALPPRVFQEKSLDAYQSELEELEREEENGKEEEMDMDVDTLREQRTRLMVEKEQVVKKLKGVTRRSQGSVREVTVDKPEELEDRYRRLKALVGVFSEEDSDEEGSEEGDEDEIDLEQCETFVHEFKAWRTQWRKKGIDVELWKSGGEKDNGIEDLKKQSKEHAALRPVVVVEEMRDVWERALQDYKGDLGERQHALGEVKQLLERWKKADREYDDAIVRMAELKRQQKQYTKLPFNPDCVACQSQPWRGVLENVQKELESVLLQVGEKGTELESVGEKLQRLMEEVGGNEEDNVEGDEEEQELGEAAAAFCEKEEARLRGWQRALDAQMWATWKEKEAALRHKLQEKERVEGLVEEQVEWFRLRKKVAGWVRQKWEECRETWEAWKAWNEEGLWICLEKIENQILEVDGAIAFATRYRERVKKIEKLREIVGCFPAWREEAILRRRLETVEKEMGNVGKQMERMEERTIRKGIEMWVEGVESRLGVLEVLSEVFKGYRKWLYTAYLGPRIGNAVNRLLVDICEGRPLLLEGEWNEEVGTFVWFLRDGDVRVVFEKASGFQRFIVGMAMRVAMSRLGICKVVFEQLFVDEGFTACDSDNLDRVPAFLRGLLKAAYRCIVLATHLDDLKACGDVQVGIVREGGGVSRMCG